MTRLTEEGRRILAQTAARHQISPQTATELLMALHRGHGHQAQFNIAELGGMGQWQNGMVMVGDMFNQGLKARVDALCRDLSAALHQGGLFAPEPSETATAAGQDQQGAGQGGAGQDGAGQGGSGGGGSGWPASLGQPAAQGAQNDMRYAYFPHSQRLAVAQGGQITLYDTAEHHIQGFGQAQGGGQSLTFTSQLGTLPLDRLQVVPA